MPKYYNLEYLIKFICECYYNLNYNKSYDNFITNSLHFINNILKPNKIDFKLLNINYPDLLLDNNELIKYNEIYFNNYKIKTYNNYKYCLLFDDFNNDEYNKFIKDIKINYTLKYNYNCSLLNINNSYEKEYNELINLNDLNYNNKNPLYEIKTILKDKININLKLDYNIIKNYLFHCLINNLPNFINLDVEYYLNDNIINDINKYYQFINITYDNILNPIINVYNYCDKINNKYIQNNYNIKLLINNNENIEFKNKKIKLLMNKTYNLIKNKYNIENKFINYLKNNDNNNKFSISKYYEDDELDVNSDIYNIIESPNFLLFFNYKYKSNVKMLNYRPNDIFYDIMKKYYNFDYFKLITDINNNIIDFNNFLISKDINIYDDIVKLYNKFNDNIYYINIKINNEYNIINVINDIDNYFNNLKKELNINKKFIILLNIYNFILLNNIDFYNKLLNNLNNDFNIMNDIIIIQRTNNIDLLYIKNNNQIINLINNFNNYEKYKIYYNKYLKLNQKKLNNKINQTYINYLDNYLYDNIDTDGKHKYFIYINLKKIISKIIKKEDLILNNIYNILVIKDCFYDDIINFLNNLLLNENNKKKLLNVKFINIEREYSYIQHYNIDIQFNIFTTINKENYINRLTNIFNEYYKEYSECLKLMEYKFNILNIVNGQFDNLNQKENKEKYKKKYDIKEYDYNDTIF